MSETVARADPKRAHWIGAPDYFNLNHALASVAEAFGHHCYLVGSACAQRDYRDIDIRCILPDEEFDALFGARSYATHDTNPRLSLMNASLSGCLRDRTSLPIDFQFQRRTEANEQYPTTLEQVDRHADGSEYRTKVRIRERQPIGYFLAVKAV